MNTQTQLILKALKANKSGIHPTYIIETLHIFQYNARIYELRKQFGCECKNGYRCSAQEHIVNKRLANGTTVFVYERAGQDVDWEKMRQEVVQYQSPSPSPEVENLSLFS